MVWGNRKGYSSSGSAFMHNAMTEMSKLLGEHSPTVMMDMWKCFDTVNVSSRFSAAREVGYLLRLLWQLVTSYKMPRAVKAFGS
eukprot:138618-Pyramimonas_sp.AAC.1